jgi:hypothetical protein
MQFLFFKRTATNFLTEASVVLIPLSTVVNIAMGLYNSHAMNFLFGSTLIARFSSLCQRVKVFGKLEMFRQDLSVCRSCSKP